jgi:splicing factor 3B subunit 2
MAAPKMTKNQMRRAKKKEQKKAQAEVSVAVPSFLFVLVHRLTVAAKRIQGARDQG